MITSLIQFLVVHYKKFLLSALAVTLFLVYYVPEIKIVTSVEHLYPSKKDPDRQFLEQMESLFGEDASLIVALKADEVFRTETLKKIRDLSNDIKKVPHVTRVDSLATAKRVVSTQEEMRTIDFLEDIPNTDSELKALKKEYFDNPLYRNAYVSEDSRFAVMNVVLEPEETIGNIPAIVDQIRRLTAHYQGPERIFVSGQSELNTSFNDSMQRDRRRLVPVILLVMLLILYLNFRSVIGFLLPLVSVLIGVLWTFGVMSLFDVPISILTSTLPAILIAIGSSYAIYFLAAYFSLWSQERDPIEHVRRVLNRTLLAVIFCAFSTIVGFFGLWLNDVHLIREMGIAAIIGIACLLALTAFVLPSSILLIGVIQRSRQREKMLPLRLKKRISWMEILPRRYMGRSHWILCFWILIVCVCFYFIPQLKIENDPSTFFKKTSDTWLNLQSLISELKMYGRFKIVLKAKEDDYFKRPKVLHQMERLERHIKRHREIGKTMSLTDFIKTINKSFNEQRPEYERIPETQKEVAQYLLLYSLSGDEETLHRYVSENYRITQIVINAGVTSSQDILDLVNRLEKDCQLYFGNSLSCRVSGGSLMLAKSAHYIAFGVLKGFGLALCMILVLMFLLFRSLKIGFVAMIPNVVPMIFLLGFMGASGLPLNVGTSVILTIALGIAVDNTLHFFVHYYQVLKQSNHFLIQSLTGIRITEDQKWAVVKTWRHLYGAFLTTSLCVMCGFLVLTLSDLIPLIHFGSLTAMTMLFALISDLTLTPALILKTRF